jgi:hypothetical protein
MAYAYSDPDEPAVSREVDIIAYRSIYANPELVLGIGSQVIAECKQSAMPYVLIGKPESVRPGDRPLEQQFRFPMVEIGRTPVQGAEQLLTTQAADYLGLFGVEGNPWSTRFVAAQMTRLDRKKEWYAHNESIFTSLTYPLAKALTHFWKRHNEPEHEDHEPGDWAEVRFCYPIVVTSAPLYVVDVSGDPLRPTQAPWASMTRRISTSKIEGQFHIDVVNFDHLSDYLEERVMKFAGEVARLAKVDAKRYVTRVDHSYGI